MQDSFKDRFGAKYKVAPSGIIENFNKDTSDNDIIELLQLAIESLKKVIDCKPFTYIWLNGTIKFLKSLLDSKKSQKKFTKNINNE